MNVIGKDGKYILFYLTIMELNKITIINACHKERIKYLEKFMCSLKDISCNKLCCVTDKALINFDTYGFKILESSGNYFDRMYKCLNNTTTKYIMQCSEDDLYNKEYIIQSINFLDNNSDYVSVWGYSVIPSHSVMQGKYNKTFNAHIKNSHKLFSSNPIERINNYLIKNNKNYSTNQNVLKLDMIKSLYLLIKNNKNLQSYSYLDKIELIYYLFFGNIKTLNILQVTRGTLPSIINVEKGLEYKQWITFFNYAEPFCKLIHMKTEISYTIIIDTIRRLRTWKNMINY